MKDRLNIFRFRTLDFGMKDLRNQILKEIFHIFSWNKLLGFYFESDGRTRAYDLVDYCQTP